MQKLYAPFTFWEPRVLLPPGETSLVCFQHIKIEFNLPALFGQKSGWVYYVLRSRLSKTFSLPGKWWQGLCWRCRRRTSCGDESLPVHTSWRKTTVDFTKSGALLATELAIGSNLIPHWPCIVLTIRKKICSDVLSVAFCYSFCIRIRWSEEFAKNRSVPKTALSRSGQTGHHASPTAWANKPGRQSENETT